MKRSKWYTCTIEPNMKGKKGLAFDLLVVGKTAYITYITTASDGDVTEINYHQTTSMNINNVMAYLSGYNPYNYLTGTRISAKLRIVR